MRILIMLMLTIGASGCAGATFGQTQAVTIEASSDASGGQLDALAECCEHTAAHLTRSTSPVWCPGLGANVLCY